MAETRSDKLAEQYDALRLDVSSVADDCRKKSELIGLSGIERQAWMFKEFELRGILAKYPQRNVPPVKKG